MLYMLRIKITFTICNAKSATVQQTCGRMLSSFSELSIRSVELITAALFETTTQTVGSGYNYPSVKLLAVWTQC